MCLKECRSGFTGIRVRNGLPAFLLSLLASIPVSGQVKVWEGVLKLPTYEEGPPDANPPFDQFAIARFNYPYTLRNEITNKRTEHEWRAVYLENEYLKCSVLPDIGGHIYTCIDKISGQPMFRPSRKHGLAIAERGLHLASSSIFRFRIIGFRCHQ